MKVAAQFIDFANELADAAAGIVRPYFRTPMSIDAKADDSPVTRADREAEEKMRAMIARRFPHHGIYGEEYGQENTNAEFVWVLDPIDGTLSFITGKPLFGTLIALCHQGVPVLGILDQPILRERWIGAEGSPTRMSGRKISVRECPSLAQAVLSTTSPHLFGDRFARFEKVRTQAARTVYGSDCYAYGLLAAGFVDIVVESGLKPYDFAALVPIIQGAEGLMTDWQGQPLTLASEGNVLACGDARVQEKARVLLS